MEIPRKCSTGTYAIDGFSTVHHCTYTVASTLSDPGNAGPLLWNAQALLRDQGYLVASDQTKVTLWIFAGPNAASDGASGDFPSLRAVKKILNKQRQQFEYSGGGSFNAANLYEFTGRTTAKPSPAPRASSVAKNSKTSTNQDTEAVHSVEHVYRLFVLAVASSISYVLVRHYEMIPLNVRSFFFRIHSNSDISSDSADLCKMSIDVCLSTSGTLLVSSAHGAYHTERSIVAPRPYLSAPPNDDKSFNSVQSPSLSCTGGFGLTWKTALQFWLRSKGITISKSNTPRAWTFVPSADMDRSELAQGVLLPPALTSKLSYEWPTDLCLNDTSPSRDEAAGIPSSSLKNLEDIGASHVQDGPDIINSFNFAQDWVLGSDERRKAVETLHLMKRAEKENFATQLSVRGNDASLPSSPVYPRAAELSGTNAIYPTPPDGFTSQAPNTSSLMVTDHSSDARNEEPPERGGPTVTLDPHPNGLSPGFAEPTAQATDLENELFDDMGENGFGEAGVTDADFSFFDEPEGENMDISFDEHLQLDDSKNVSSEQPSVHNFNHELDIKAESTQDDLNDPQPALSDNRIKDTARDDSDLEDLQLGDRNGTDSAVPLKVEQGDDRRPLKAITPELSPSLVQKRLFKDSANTESITRHIFEHPNESTQAFNPVSFGAKILSFDQKYGQSGRFSFDVRTASTSPLQKSKTDPTSTVEPRKQLLFDTRETHRIPRSASTIATTENYQSEDSSDEGYSSETDSDSYSNDGCLAHPKSFSPIPHEDEQNYRYNKRKRHCSEASSSPKYPLKKEGSDQLSLNVSELRATTKQEACSLIHQIDSRFCGSAEWSQSLSHSPPLSQNVQMNNRDEFRAKILQDHEAIDIAQTISGEHIYTRLETHSQVTGNVHSGAINTVDIENMMEYSLHDALKRLFHMVRDCDLQTMASVQEATPESSLTKAPQRPVLQRKQTESSSSYNNSIFRLTPPHVKVQRSEKVLHVLPPAVRFWETLGLAPFSGPKDLLGYCIYPSTLRTEKAIVQFFECLAIVYENRKLGAHEIDASGANSGGCLFSYELDNDAGLADSVKTIQSTCIDVGTSLANKKIDGKNLVVYVVNPFQDHAAFSVLCQAAWSTFQAYNKSTSASRADSRRPEIVLKILDINTIPREDAILDPNPEDVLHLAHEMYERCPSTSPERPKPGLNIGCPPSVQLATAIPKSVQFKITTDPPSDLLEENSFFHLAYSRSPSDQWLTAAWTDNAGEHHATASYSLYGRKFEEVASELWETTLGILKRKTINWRIVVVKEGLFMPNEMEVWTKLFTAAAQLQVTTILIALDVAPCLNISSDRMLPANVAENFIKPQSYTGNNAVNIATPVSTPTTSTDHATATPSPSTGADSLLESNPDSRLLDQADETWGVVLGIRLRTACMMGDWCPSLVSGLLVKRGNGSRSADPSSSKRMPCIAVHVTWVGNNTGSASAPSINTSSPAALPGMIRNYELLLREVLGMYRNLGTLAKVRFVDDGMGGIIPWHVMAAMRGAKALDRCLPV